jgi:competence protein ComEC
MALRKDWLYIHILNVGDGDAIILELPRYQDETIRRFGIVDCGNNDKVFQYLKKLLPEHPTDYWIQFLCITHPHKDHYGGISPIMETYGFSEHKRIRQFWDSGFRTNSVTYNTILQQISQEDSIVFIRQSAGAEFEFGEVRIIVLAPSIDLRNRYDTYGVNINNSSIVLKVIYKDSIIILGGDAQFDSWGKVCEEFPRISRIKTWAGADSLPEYSEINQLNCQVLKVSHHCSKHGTSLEYLEKMSPSYCVISCAGEKEGDGKSQHGFPHQLAYDILLEEVKEEQRIFNTARDGSLIIRCTGSNRPKIIPLSDSVDEILEPYSVI